MSAESWKLGWVGAALGLGVGCSPRVPANVEPESGAEPLARGTPTSKPEPERTREPGVDHQAPILVRAELIDGNHLRLHFSEAIDAEAGFALDDFRISGQSVYVNRHEGYASAYYYDMGYMLYGEATSFTASEVHAERVDIELRPIIDPGLCFQLEREREHAAPGTESRSGLYLHYAPRGRPLRDLAGNPLAPFGTEWVLARDADPPLNQRELEGPSAAQTTAGLIPIHCGPALPPGPR